MKQTNRNHYIGQLFACITNNHNQHIHFKTMEQLIIYDNRYVQYNEDLNNCASNLVWINADDLVDPAGNIVHSQQNILELIKVQTDEKQIEAYIEHQSKCRK